MKNELKQKVSRAKTHDEFVKQATAIHNGEYVYLGVYQTAKSKLEIKHTLCGTVFTQTPNAHLLGRGCKKCGIAKRTKLLARSQEEFLTRAMAIHGDHFEYMSPYVNDKTKITMRHRCGHVFSQQAGSHLNGSGCAACKRSRGEQMVRKWLEANGLVFLYHHKFEDCINPNTGYRLVFDFYLPEQNTAIEFEGPQHNGPFKFYGMSQDEAEAAYVKCKFRDKIKEDYCRNNKIELVRICFVYDKLFKSKINDVLISLLD